MNLLSEVDLGVIRRNVEAVRRKTRVRVLVMVKADAYGHGMTAVARALEGTADRFGVATPEEGVELRKTAFQRPFWSRCAVLANLPPRRGTSLPLRWRTP